MWGWGEIELLGLLINAGHKFKKSWKNILQHGLVNRQESATSVKWYQLAKGGMVQTSGNYATLKNFGKGKSDNAKVRLAKKLAKARVEAMPKPPTRAEILEERRLLMELHRMRHLRRYDKVHELEEKLGIF